MKKNKTIKQLMALGISRNDAAGFVATYNKLNAKQRSQYLPNVVFDMRPAPPFLRENKKIINYAARTMILDDDISLSRLDPEEREGVGRSRVLEKLCRGVVGSKAVTIEKRRYDVYKATEMIARIQVVEP